MSTPELKPLLNCPFCGNPVWIHSFMGDGFRLARVPWEQISCDECRIETEPEQPGCRKPDLSTRWNTRHNPAESALNAAREALKDLLATARNSSWAHITNATPDDPCRCKECSMKKARAALAQIDKALSPQQSKTT